MGRLFTLEGINGTGKTTIINCLKKEFEKNTDIIILDEIFDEEHEGLIGKIYDALYYTENRFFNMGMPLTETMLLLSRLTYQYESVINNGIKSGKTIITDRGIDTFIVLQSIMISRKYKQEYEIIMNELINFTEKLLVLPDTTFLLYGDFEKSIKRAEERDEKPFSDEEIEILKLMEEKYIAYAQNNKSRYMPINIKTVPLCDIKKVIINTIISKMS